MVDPTWPGSVMIDGRWLRIEDCVYFSLRLDPPRPGCEVADAGLTIVCVDPSYS